jgi:hypothetical protein
MLAVSELCLPGFVESKLMGTLPAGHQGFRYQWGLGSSSFSFFFFGPPFISLLLVIGE